MILVIVSVSCAAGNILNPFFQEVLLYYGVHIIQIEVYLSDKQLLWEWGDVPSAK